MAAKTNDGSTMWPEQEACEAWWEKHRQELKDAVTKERLRQQRLAAPDFLTALRRRDDLCGWLDRNDIEHRVLPDDHPDHPGAVMFELGEEHWLAAYHANGNFKLLAWA